LALPLQVIVNASGMKAFHKRPQLLLAFARNPRTKYGVYFMRWPCGGASTDLYWLGEETNGSVIINTSA
jgi:hypothetical protein